MRYLVDTDKFASAYLKQLRDKKNDTIKCIDGVLETAMNLECTNIDGDVTFDNCSDYFIHDFESTLLTIIKSLELTGLNYLIDCHNDLIIEITHDKDFIKFLSEHTGSIKNYQQVRNEVSEWMKD